MEGYSTPVLDFPVLSVERPSDANVELGRRDDDDVLRVEDIYAETGDWEPGDEAIGRLYLRETRTGQAGHVVLTATFEFEDAAEVDLLVLTGLARKAGPKLLPGRLGVSAGTGRFKRDVGSVRFEVKNPKRWSA